LPILGLEQVAAVPEVLHSQANIFHEVGGEGLKRRVGIACLDLFPEHFALAGFIGIAGKQAEVAIFQLFAKFLRASETSVTRAARVSVSNFSDKPVSFSPN
jgi:hypothetical protein